MKIRDMNHTEVAITFMNNTEKRRNNGLSYIFFKKQQQKNITLLQLHRKLKELYIHILEGTNVGVTWSNVVVETEEPGKNHQFWMGDHYPATCSYPDMNPNRRGDKRVCYTQRYPGPILYMLSVENPGFVERGSLSPYDPFFFFIVFINFPTKMKHTGSKAGLNHL